MRTLAVSLSEHPLAMLRGIAELRGVVARVELPGRGRVRSWPQRLGDEAATAERLAGAHA